MRSNVLVHVALQFISMSELQTLTSINHGIRTQLLDKIGCTLLELNANKITLHKGNALEVQINRRVSDIRIHWCVLGFNLFLTLPVDQTKTSSMESVRLVNTNWDYKKIHELTKLCSALSN